MGLSCFALALSITLIATGHTLGGDPWTILVLVTVNALAERSGVWITSTTEMSIALLPTLFAAVLFGPLAAGLVNASAMLGDPEVFTRADPDRAPRLKLASYASSRFITGVAAGIMAQALIGVSSSDLGALTIATLGAAIVAEVLDMLFAAITSKIRGRNTLRGVLKPLVPLL